MPAIGANLISTGDPAKRVIDRATAMLERYHDFVDGVIGT
jgi:hypothetical protein